MAPCSKCGVDRTADTAAKAGRGVIRTTCKSCWAAYVRGYNARNREAARARHREYKRRRPREYRSAALKTTFGITLGDYEMMLEDQGGVCACCRRPETALYTNRGFRKVKALSVDHCHETGTVRALLCTKCNTALGLLEEDPAIIALLLAYAEKHAQPALRLVAATER